MLPPSTKKNMINAIKTFSILNSWKPNDGKLPLAFSYIVIKLLYLIKHGLFVKVTA